MRNVIVPILAFLLCAVGANCQSKENVKTENSNMEKKILFINGSPNKDGNTANLAKVLLGTRKYETINLTNYKINFYGQTMEGDQLDEIVAKMKSADVVVIGSPVYWHNICASVRAMMERFYGYLSSDDFEGKELYFLYQGEAPTKKMIDDGEYTMERFAALYGFDYKGMATNEQQAKSLSDNL